MSNAPYTEVNEPWPTYERGWWVRLSALVPVYDPWEEKNNGFSKQISYRLGLVHERKNQRYCIQFGASGPFEWHHKDALTLATKSQVAYMEGTSV